jgi:hypothetical protein
MPVIQIGIPVPGFIYSPLNRIRRVLIPQAAKPATGPRREPNLEGDRDIEWTWINAQMPSGPGRALDFGTGDSHLAFQAALSGYEVTSIDLGPVHRLYSHPKIRYLQSDLLKMKLPKESLDLVINCSTIEHVGLSGRYGVTDPRPNGDLEAMEKILQAMKPGAKMLLTIPVGLDQVFSPLCRVYGEKRLPLLLKGYSILKEEYWQKENSNIWSSCSRTEALQYQASAGSWSYLENIYAIGCLMLQKPDK